MRRLHLITVIISVMIILLNGCNPTNFDILKNKDGILLTSPKHSIKIEIINPSIIRVFSYKKHNMPEKQSLVVDTIASKSSWKLNEDKKAWIIETGRLQVSVSKKSGQITYFDKEGNQILAEGPRQYKETIVMKDTTFHIKQCFSLDKNEGIYGLGQYQEGIMNWRGHTQKMVQGNKEAVVPFLISTKEYGLYWDNYSYTVFHDSADCTSLWSEAGDAIDYYFIYGTNMDNVIAGYRDLTGQAPLYGKWAYGFWQCKERYKTQEELLSVAKEYRERKIPIDNIVQDWQYWGDHGWNAMKFDRNIFPNPKSMINQLHHMNYHLMISIWPVLGAGTPIEQELREKGLLYPYHHQADGYIYDAFSEEAREIYWKYLDDAFFSIGMDAWWMDATEPEFSLVNHPDSMARAAIECGGYTALGSWAKLLNAYSLMTTMGVYKNQRKTTSDKRVYILTRSAFAGQQKYAATTWSGDISATWDVFRNQVAAGLNFCMAGIPYWTTDIGAFFTSNKDGSFVKGSKGNAYREFYTRWFQFGAFCPIFRSHGTNTPREVWQFGEPGDWAYDIQVKFDKLRYRLLPYIYSNAWKITNEGYTIMRGLAMDFNEDQNVYNINDQYMFGDAFLVNPVTKPLYYSSDAHFNAIPPDLLIDKNNDKGGLTGEYYKGTGFDKKSFERKDSVIDFNWNSNVPKGLAADFFSIRWTGKVLAKEDGVYKFITTADDGVRLWVDEKLIIDDWNKHALVMNEGTIELKSGKEYDIVMEYYEDVGQAEVKLGWLTPSQKKKNKVDKKKSREVYLPGNITWYDFWTGKSYTGGQTITAQAPIEIMPLFVKAGSIIPMGPQKQYATEKNDDTLELRIYPGADGEFTLYEDENDNYNYEKGTYATIEFKWNDKARELIIGDCDGSFPGMLNKRIFNIVLVGKYQGTGVMQSEIINKTIKYTGNKLVVAL